MILELSNKNNKKPSTNFLIGIFLIATTLLIYSQTWTYDHVCYDDPLFLDNPNVKKGLSFESIKWSLTESTAIANYWIPITWLSFIVDTEIFGNNYGGFHFTNTIFHTFNVILLFIFCLKIFKSTLPSGVAAFLFSVHPINVEPVAWITCRKDMLCAFFWLAGLITYIEYTKCIKQKDALNKNLKVSALYISLLMLFLMGIMSKPMMLTFPFVLLLLDFYPLKRAKTDISTITIIIRLIIEKLPFFLIVALLSILTYTTQKNGNVLTISTDNYSWTLRLFNAFVAYNFYLKKLFFPINLALLYPYPEKFNLSVHLFPLIFVALTTIYFILRVRQYPFLLIGWLWFLGTLVPVIGIYIVGLFLYTDRYAYIPLIGLYIIIGYIVETIIRNKPHAKQLIIVLITPIISVFAVISFMQVTYWKDSIRLFERAVYINPQSSIAHNNLGYSYMGIGQFQKSALHLSKSIELTPNYFSPYYNLGGVFYLTKQYHKAIQFYKKTIQLKPDYYMAYLNMGIVFGEIGDHEQANKSLLKSIELNPDSKRARYFINKNINVHKEINAIDY